MKILLVGEYSNLHNSLKQGLTALGHQVELVTKSHSFLGLDADFPIENKLTKMRFFQFLHKILVKFDFINIEEMETAYGFYHFLKNAKHYDHIQLISSDGIRTHPFFNQFLYKMLFKKSEKRSLLFCSEDTPIADFYLKNRNRYSIFTAYLENREKKSLFQDSLKYVKKSYRKMFDFVKNHCQNLITTDFDYETPMRKMSYKTTFIPYPINTDKIIYKENIIADKIVIFLGINRFTRHKKGISFFEEALQKIQQNYAEKVEIIITENIPYEEYIKIYDKANILLDQIYAYDQGYNALTAMAQGKVVFTGAGEDWQEHFGVVEDSIAIHALPDAEIIYQKLENLIQNPQKITEIGRKARDFVEKEHHYIKIAEKYLDTWQNPS